MNHKSLQTSQKLRGAYYTPEKIVKLFLKWSIDEKKIQNILEPSAGDGRFINNLIVLRFCFKYKMNFHSVILYIKNMSNWEELNI